MLLELIIWLDELIANDEELLTRLLELTGACDDELATLLETASLLGVTEELLEGVVVPVHATESVAAMTTGRA